MQNKNNDEPGFLIYFLGGIMGLPMSFFIMKLCVLVGFPLAILAVLAGGVNLVAYSILTAMVIRTTERDKIVKLILFLAGAFLYFHLLCGTIAIPNPYVLFSVQALVFFLPCIVLGIVSWQIRKAEKRIKENAVLCNQCGNENPEGSEFCFKCGTKLGTDVPAPQCPEGASPAE